MAIVKRHDKAGKVWYMTDLRDSRGRRIREYAGTKRKEAETLEAERKIAIRAGSYLPRVEREAGKAEPEPALDLGPTFREFLENRFIPEYAKLRRSDYYEQNAKPLLACFDEMRLETIRASDVERYRVQREAAFQAKHDRSIGPSTLRKELTVLGTLFKTAIRWGLLGADPSSAVAKPKEPKHRLRFLTVEEWTVVAAELPAWLRPLALLAVATGMRLKEVVSLRWEDLDKQARVIYVREGKTECREIPMSDPVRRFLEAQPIRAEFVFTGKDSLPYISTRARNGISQVTSAAMRRAGITGCGFHVLRHTAASWMVQAGRPLFEVGLILGHKDPKMTMRYAHLQPRHLLSTAEAIPVQVWTPIGHLLTSGSDGAQA